MNERPERNNLTDISDSNVWYHGSPLRLEILATGSTITREILLAKIFSHKPQIVSIEDEVVPPRIRHNGKLPGFLYQVNEPIDPGDLVPHPNSSMAPGMEWITRRPLRLLLIGPVEIDPTELLSQEEIYLIRSRTRS